MEKDSGLRLRQVLVEFFRLVRVTYSLVEVKLKSEKSRFPTSVKRGRDDLFVY